MQTILSRDKAPAAPSDAVERRRTLKIQVVGVDTVGVRPPLTFSHETPVLCGCDMAGRGAVGPNATSPRLAHHSS